MGKQIQRSNQRTKPGKCGGAETRNTKKGTRLLRSKKELGSRQRNKQQRISERKNNKQKRGGRKHIMISLGLLN